MWARLLGHNRLLTKHCEDAYSQLEGLVTTHISRRHVGERILVYKDCGHSPTPGNCCYEPYHHRSSFIIGIDLLVEQTPTDNRQDLGLFDRHCPAWILPSIYAD